MSNPLGNNAPGKVELPSGLEATREDCVEQVQRLQARVRKEFTDWFGRGYAAIAVQRTPAANAYLLVPWSEF